jgi:hypothetical protein
VRRLLTRLSFDLKTAFDARSTSAREMMRQVQASRFKKANPKLQIRFDIHGRVDKPIVQFSFADGTEVRKKIKCMLHIVVGDAYPILIEQKIFDCQEDLASDMMFQVHLKTMQLDAEYEMAGKSIDEM